MNHALKMNFKKICKKHKEILILTLIFLLIRLFFLIKFHGIIWDEAVYIGMGKFIYSLGEIGLWEPARPILLPLLVGLIWKIGLNVVFFSVILIYFFSIGNIFLTYLIGTKLFNKKTGLIASFFLVITPTFFLYSSYILTEIVSSFFVLTALYFFINKKLIPAGVFSALAFLSRFPQGLILAVLLVTIITDYILNNKKTQTFIKDLLKVALTFLIATFPYLIFNYFMYKKDTCCLHHALFRPLILAVWHQGNPAEWVINGTLSSYLFNLFYYPLLVFKENPFLILIIPAVILFFKNRYYKKIDLNVFLVAIIVYLGYYTYILNKQMRFSLVFVPFMALLSSYGFIELVKLAKKKRLFKVIFSVAVMIIFLFVVVQDSTYYGWRSKNPPKIVPEFYKYFIDKNIKGHILTADPVPVVYVDAKFLPFYFSIKDAEKIYDENKENSFYVVYTSKTFFCQELDIGCSSEINEFSRKIKEENKLIFSKKYGDREYYIYQNK